MPAAKKSCQSPPDRRPPAPGTLRIILKATASPGLSWPATVFRSLAEFTGWRFRATMTSPSRIWRSSAKEPSSTPVTSTPPRSGKLDDSRSLSVSARTESPNFTGVPSSSPPSWEPSLPRRESLATISARSPTVSVRSLVLPSRSMLTGTLEPTGVCETRPTSSSPSFTGFPLNAVMMSPRFDEVLKTGMSPALSAGLPGDTWVMKTPEAPPP